MKNFIFCAALGLGRARVDSKFFMFVLKNFLLILSRKISTCLKNQFVIKKKNLHFSKKPRFFEMEKMFYTYLRKLN